MLVADICSPPTGLIASVLDAAQPKCLGWIQGAYIGRFRDTDPPRLPRFAPGVLADKSSVTPNMATDQENRIAKVDTFSKYYCTRPFLVGEGWRDFVDDCDDCERIDPARFLDCSISHSVKESVSGILLLILQSSVFSSGTPISCSSFFGMNDLNKSSGGNVGSS